MVVTLARRRSTAFHAITMLLAATALTAMLAWGPSTAEAATGCQPAGDTGQTAVYVNESVSGKVIDLGHAGCDIAIFFDENAPGTATVANTEVISAATGDGTGIWNHGANVSVTNSTFTTISSGQFVPIRFDNGARGVISGNDLNGTHRAGVVVRGDGTDADIRGNSITGSGAKTSGWAENGIQIDRGATARVNKNTLTGHWWDGESNWASTAIMVLTDGVSVTNNELKDNEFSVYVVGNGNRVTGNDASSTVVSQSSLAFVAWGVLLAGAGNHLSGNSISSVGAGAGVYIFPGSVDNRVTGNRISGFAAAIVDGGANTMARGNPSPVN